MKIGYTEFSFGYAFTENLIRWGSTRPTGAPVFPNLLQEGQLGYDVRIDFPGAPVFFQYKLPELMVRNSAVEISQFALSGIAVPFFRMPLMRRDLSQQHQLLIELETEFRSSVLYATPGMENGSDFNDAYSVARVHQQSFFFSPCDIGPLPDDKQHVVVYQNGLGYAWLCSDPREVPSYQFDIVDKRIRTLLSEPRFSRLDAAAGLIRTALLARVSPQLRAAEGAIRQRVRARSVADARVGAVDAHVREVVEDLLVAREIARVGLGLDMVVAQSTPPSEA